MKRGDKKAQNLTLGTIILIVLGVAVLVFLIWGFSIGWSNLWDKISVYTGGSNLDTIKQACILSCEGGRATEYCGDIKTLKLSDGTKIRGSCKNFEDDTSINIGTCSGIGCTPGDAGNTYKQKCGDLDGEWKDSCGEKEELTNKVKNKEDHTDKCCKK